MPEQEKAIRVRILDREFGLRIHHDSEDETREIAAYVDARMQAFRRAHPEQPELTAAIISALAIAEELFTAREQYEAQWSTLEGELSALDDHLASALPPAE
ncbi:MAG TPA: cell division protein ZapA [Rhodothermales bacterium]|nr:cell division protein ZapA [Rhodothermales bacterium]